MGEVCSDTYPLIVCCYDWSLEESQIGWSAVTDNVEVPGDLLAGWVGAGWSSQTIAHPISGDLYEVISVRIALPAGSNVFAVVFNYTAGTPVALGYTSGPTGFSSYGTGLPGVDVEFEVATELTGVSDLVLTMSVPQWGSGGIRAAFVLNSVCITISNPLSECP
jgi:hypothetical protein